MTIKLNAQQIESIKLEFAAGNSQRVIAEKYGVSRSGIAHHTKGKHDNRPKVEKVCKQCEQIFSVFDNSSRRFCTDACRIASVNAAAQHRLDEFKWIAGTDAWDNIATRVGFGSVKRLREWLRASGEHEWADRIAQDQLLLRERQGRWAA